MVVVVRGNDDARSCSGGTLGTVEGPATAGLSADNCENDIAEDDGSTQLIEELPKSDVATSSIPVDDKAETEPLSERISCSRLCTISRLDAMLSSTEGGGGGWNSMRAFDALE